MDVKDIINEGRPVEPYSFETDNEVTWYKIGANDGYEYAIEEFENNRLKACDNQTPQEAWRESEFVVPFVREHHRVPTFTDAIEITRKQMIDKICKWIDDNAFEYVETKTVGIMENYKRFDSEKMITDLKKAMEE